MIYSVKELLTSRGISGPVFVWGILRKKNGEYFLEDLESPDYMLNVSNVKEGGRILLDVLEGVPTVLKYDPHTTAISTIRRLTLEGNKLTFMVNGEYYVIDIPPTVIDKLKKTEGEVEEEEGEEEGETYPQDNFYENDEEEEPVEEEIESYYKSLENREKEQIPEIDFSEVTARIEELKEKIDDAVEKVKETVDVNKAIKSAIEELAGGDEAEETIEKIVEKKIVSALKVFSKKEIATLKTELEIMEINLKEINDELKKTKNYLIALIFLICIEMLFLNILLTKSL